MRSYEIWAVIVLSAAGFGLKISRRDNSPHPKLIEVPNALPAQFSGYAAPASRTRHASFEQLPSSNWVRPEPGTAGPVWPGIECHAPDIVVVNPEPELSGPLAEVGTQALNDPDPSAREQAVLQLCGSEKEEAVPFLTAALRDPEPRIWQQSLAGVRRFGNRVSLQALVEVTANDPDPDRREQILSLVCHLAALQAREVFSNEPE